MFRCRRVQHEGHGDVDRGVQHVAGALPRGVGQEQRVGHRQDLRARRPPGQLQLQLHRPLRRGHAQSTPRRPRPTGAFFSAVFILLT